MISGNIWGGYGRRGGAQTKLDEVPEPTNDVINNLMNVAMSENQKKDFIDFYKKLYNK